MGSWETPRSRRQNILVQKLGDETLLYDGDTHKAFCLNRSSATVWELANGERTLAELASSASLELNAPMTEELAAFAIEELRREGLLELPPGGVVAAAFPSRRVLLQRAGIGCALLLPVIVSIVAPTAAQAYSGCVDCSLTPSRRRPSGTSSP